jgi:Tol biopolymer transport system component
LTVSPGTRLGPYEILTLVGAGGMGEVYKANDPRLGRTVAIKILPRELAADPQFRERFDREARTISHLDHPHICALHDVGEQDGTAYLVMQYLEGETLAERLTRGALPLDQTLRNASDVADALDKAHRAGIVHRDLKPGNIFLTKSGVKLLDFGLAKLAPAGPGFSGVTMTPTGAANVTAQGAILGTLQYMAPEQLEGREADARTDIFAFGAVVYEMATGRKAFEGKSQASLISSIMGGDPPAMTTLQPLTPPGFERIVRKCLVKDPDDRWQTARDLASELKWVAQSVSSTSVVASPGGASATARQSRTRERLWMAIAVISLAGAVAAVSYPAFKTVPPAIGVVRFTIPPPERATLSAGAARVSPDGRRLAFIAFGSEGGGTSLWLHSVDSFASPPVTGSDGASFPAWSTDGRFVSFFQGNKLKKVEFGTSTLQTLCDFVGAPRGATWNRDGVILFATGGGSVFRIADAGGAPTALTTLNAEHHETAHGFPWFLPDGKHFLYLVTSSDAEHSGLYVASLDEPRNATFIVRTDYDGAYASGHLLFVRERSLMAQPFDPGRLRLSGTAVPIAEQVEVAGNNRAGFSVSENGFLITRFGTFNTQLTWFERSGKQLEAVGPPDVYRNPALSPDGRRVMVERPDPQSGKSDLWLRDLARGTISRFTFDPADDVSPAWSPDGMRVVFYSGRDPHGLYVKNASSTGAEELILKTDALGPEQWSPDGRLILYDTVASNTGVDIFVFPLGKDLKPSAYIQTRFNEVHAQLSPNGKWMAYTSNESGRYEVYVQSFPERISKAQVSTAGGSQPRWRGDGKELYYIAGANRLMAVAVRAEGVFEAGVPSALFPLRLAGPPQGVRNSYAVTADGQRFLVNSIAEQNTSQIVGTLNWTEALKR